MVVPFAVVIILPTELVGTDLQTRHAHFTQVLTMVQSNRVIGSGHHDDVKSTQYYRRVGFDAQSQSHNQVNENCRRWDYCWEDGGGLSYSTNTSLDGDKEAVQFASKYGGRP